MATKFDFICLMLWRAFPLQNLPQGVTFGRFLTRRFGLSGSDHTISSYKTLLQSHSIVRNLCGTALNSEEKTESNEATENGTAAYMLLTKGMGTPVIQENVEVHPEVAEILRKSKPQKVGQNWHKPKISARRLAVLRKQYIDQGYHWPEKPMVDRGLDRLPKGRKDEKRKEERLAQIEENMKNMPKIIEDYRKRMRELKAKRREEKHEAKLKAAEAQRLGLNVRDPRALQMLDRDKKLKKR